MTETKKNNKRTVKSTKPGNSAKPVKMSALECFNRIFSTVREEDYNKKSVTKLRADLDYVSGLYHLDDISAAMLSGFLEHPEGGNLRLIAGFLGISHIECLAYKDRLTSMEKAGLIRRMEDEDKMYVITDEGQEAIVNDRPLAPAVSPEVPSPECMDVVRSSGIKAKQLFYNAKEKELVGQLASLLAEENFSEVQRRLEECGMRKGFSVIFYGSPGTGKTATVYSLAHQSGRDVFCVDISSIKSKWVGESEQRIKEVFTKYRELCKQCERTPILLFNEADGIFGKRIAVERSVDQMNNCIQNIILQEMEKLDGILIATTNLTQNLDPAFERRFIYKIQFNKPDGDVRKNILKSLITGLSDDDAAFLSTAFPSLSGGNIENVARRCTVDYVLTGVRPGLDALTSLCRSEQISQNGSGSRIGYGLK